MIGGLEGLRSGARDAQAANELDAQNAYRAHLMAMQKAQEARAQREFDWKEQDRNRLNEAYGQVRGLYDQDARVRSGDVTGEGGGIPMPRPVEERDFNRAYSGLALAKGDIASADQFRTKNRMMDIADSARAKAADPEFQKRVFDFVHKDKRFLGEWVDAVIDPKTKRVVTPGKFKLDGGKEITLTEQDRYQFAYGAALMEAGMTDEGMKVIAGVNKELGAMVDKANAQLTGAAKVNQDASESALRYNLGLEQTEASREARLASIAARNAAARGARGQAYQLVNDKGESGLFYLDKVDQKTGQVMLPPGWRFMQQKPQIELVKDGSGNPTMAVDANSKRPLWAVSPTGEREPVGGDPWRLSKDGPKQRAEAEGAGIARATVEEDDGSIGYRFIDLKNQDMVPAKTVDEVLANRRKILAEQQARGVVTGTGLPSRVTRGGAPTGSTPLTPPMQPQYGPIRSKVVPAVGEAVQNWMDKPRQRYLPGVGVVPQQGAF